MSALEMSAVLTWFTRRACLFCASSLRPSHSPVFSERKKKERKRKKKEKYRESEEVRERKRSKPCA